MPRLADRRVKIDLLRAAEEAFAEHGLATAKVVDITTRAGVSKGAFYLHFESKEDCFRQIVEGFLARLAAIVDPAQDPTAFFGLTLAEVRAQWLEHDRRVLEFCWQSRAILGMILAGGGGAPFAYLINEFAERSARQAEAGVRFAKEGGLYRDDVDASVAAALISGAYDRLVRKLIQEPKRPDIDAWSTQTQDLFLRGLLAPVERSGERAAEAKERGGGEAGEISDQAVISGRRVTKQAAKEAARGRRSKAG
jgi:AcrR family transcriptional regulator